MTLGGHWQLRPEWMPRCMARMDSWRHGYAAHGLRGAPQATSCNAGPADRSVAWPRYFFGMGQPRVAESRKASPPVAAVGFDPTQLALVELESTPLDHSGKLSWARAV